MELSQKFLKIIHISDITCTSICLLLCIIIIIPLILRFKQFNIKALRNITVSFIIGTIFVSFSFFLGPFNEFREKEYTTLCKIQGILNIGGGIVVFYSIFSATFLLSMLFSWNKVVDHHLIFFEKILNLTGWVLSIGYLLLVIFKNGFKPNNYGYCVMKNDVAKKIYYYFFFLLDIITYFFLFIVAYKISLKLKKSKLVYDYFAYDDQLEKVKRYFKLFIRFCIVQLFIGTAFVFELFFRDSYNFNPNSAAFYFWNFFIELIFSTFCGVGLLVYCYNESIWNFYLSKLCCCHKKEEEELDVEPEEEEQQDFGYNINFTESMSICSLNDTLILGEY